MDHEKKIKLYVLNKISELDKKIRFIEDLGSSNNTDTKSDAAYTLMVGMRSAFLDVLNLLGNVDGYKRVKDR